jgi:GGDEF domain-containing protein
LRAVACRLAGSLPRGAEAFRLLGGQFAILAPGFSPLEARRLADDFRRQVASEQIDIAGERAFRVTVSVGASVDRLDLEHPAAEVAVRREGLVRSALAALAAAESIGRNRTEVHRDGRDAA